MATRDHPRVNRVIRVIRVIQVIWVIQDQAKDQDQALRDKDLRRECLASMLFRRHHREGEERITSGNSPYSRGQVVDSIIDNR